MLRSHFCAYSDIVLLCLYTYIEVKMTITVEGDGDNKERYKNLSFEKNPFRSCISKFNNTFIDNAEDFDIVMPMYNLLEYSDNYSMTSGRLWSYYGDKINDHANDNAANNRINNNKTITSKCFQ